MTPKTPAPKPQPHSTEQCRAIPPCVGQHPCKCPGRTKPSNDPRPGNPEIIDDCIVADGPGNNWGAGV